MHSISFLLGLSLVILNECNIKIYCFENIISHWIKEGLTSRSERKKVVSATE